MSPDFRIRGGLRPPRHCWHKYCLRLAVVSLAVLADARQTSADRIVLRTLRSIETIVESFDEDGVRLADGKVLGWHEIHSGRVSATQQNLFDQFRKTLGDNLYRIRIRLKNRDYSGLKDLTEAVYPKYTGRSSKTSYMVFQATMWARLAESNRCGAVAPYLQCYAYLRDARKLKEEIPGDRTLQFDPKTGMTSEILPIWFDVAAAKATLPELVTAIRSIRNPPVSARIYYASMAIAAGETKTADRMLASLGSANVNLSEHVELCTAYREFLTGEASGMLLHLEVASEMYSPSGQAMANYLMGAQELASSSGDLDEALLKLLQIAASHSQTQPALAAAALALAADGCQQERFAGDSQNRRRGSILRNELLTAFPASFQARQILAKINIQKDEAN